MTEFKREDRYVVLKRKDLERLPVLLQETLWKFLDDAEFSLPQRQYVVVESDWPEDEAVFKMIEARVTGESGSAGFGIQQPDIDSMVNRFLGWKLPQHFYPDCYVSFDREKASQSPHGWPSGTNLLTAEQARKMFEYVMASTPCQAEFHTESAPDEITTSTR